MHRRIRIGLLFVGLSSLAACANHAYIPGPEKDAAEFGPDSGRCRLYAQEHRPGMSFGASGSLKDVVVETAVAGVIGGVTAAIHDSEAFDGCMQANGWLVADDSVKPTNVPQPTTVGSAVGQPVTQSPLPAPLAAPISRISPPVDNEHARQVQRAKATALAWVIAQDVLNGPDSEQRRDLYVSLCRSGDQSACFMADTR